MFCDESPNSPLSLLFCLHQHGPWARAPLSRARKEGVFAVGFAAGLSHWTRCSWGRQSTGGKDWDHTWPELCSGWGWDGMGWGLGFVLGEVEDQGSLWAEE